MRSTLGVEPNFNRSGGTAAIDGDEVRTNPMRRESSVGLDPERIVTDAANQKHFAVRCSRVAGKHLGQNCGEVRGSTPELRSIGEKIPQQLSYGSDTQGFRDIVHFVRFAAPMVRGWVTLFLLYRIDCVALDAKRLLFF